MFFLLAVAPMVHAVGGGDESNNRPSAVPLVIPELPKSGAKIAPAQEAGPEPANSPKSGKKLQIDSVEFNGNTVIDSAELQELARPYLGRMVGVDELDELRRLITHHYIDKGYVTSGATFPPNALQGKTLRISIVEGKLGEMRIEGEEWLREGYIKSRLIPDADEPLNMNVLQNRFRLLLTDPLFDHMNGRLIPGMERGISILDLEVARARPYQLSFVANNYRTPSIGAEAEGGAGWLRNLTGQGDVIDFSYMQSYGTRQYGGSWLMPIWDYGTKAYFLSSHANSRIIEPSLRQLGIQSETFSVEGGLNQQLLDNIDRRLTVSAGVGFKQNTTLIQGGNFSFILGQCPTCSNTQVSFLRLSQEYIERWATQVLALRSTFSVGLDAFGATVSNNYGGSGGSYNPLNPSSRYFSWLGQGQYNWQLPYVAGLNLVMKGNIQLSNAPLLPLERIAIGGRYTVRGYRENLMVKDNGYSGTLELHAPVLSSLNEGLPADYQFDLVPFVDYGAAWNNPDSAGGSTSAHYLCSTGVGFQLKLPHVNSELYWAQRLIDPVNVTGGNLQDAGVHFQVRLDAF